MLHQVQSSGEASPQRRRAGEVRPVDPWSVIIKPGPKSRTRPTVEKQGPAYTEPLERRTPNSQPSHLGLQRSPSQPDPLCGSGDDAVRVAQGAKNRFPFRILKGGD